MFSVVPPGEHDTRLAETNPALLETTGRGNIRCGFARREHDPNLPVGTWCYGYTLSFLDRIIVSGGARGTTSLGKERIKEGDVVGFIITLPSLDLHKKVVDGTYNKAVDDPEAVAPQHSGSGKTKRPIAGQAKDDSKGKGKGKETMMGEADTALVHGDANKYHPNLIRDRVPVLFKGHVYFESLCHTPVQELKWALPAKATAVGFEAFNAGNKNTPNADAVIHRTLPGSKIELLVNGEYIGVLQEGLRAFLPPASATNPTDRARPRGIWDDGGLGYYPAVSVMNGGAVQVKFQGPWWHGPPKDRPEVKGFNEMYIKHAVDDAFADLVDQICWEAGTSDQAQPAPAPEAKEQVEG